MINACQQCCKIFCDHADIPFDNDIFKITACTGSAAAQLESGKTIHSAAELNRKRVTYNAAQWENVNILFIDEISFFADRDLIKLYRNLRALTGLKSKIYGGRNIVFIGDFSQITPFGGDPVYAKHSIIWHDAINSAVFLNQSHRFKKDPEWGSILKRVSKGNATEDDIKKINSRVIDNERVELPKNGNICYACPTNKGRNAICTKMFYEHIKSTHPKFDEPNIDPPNHTIIIEGKIYKKKKACTQ